MSTNEKKKAEARKRAEVSAAVGEGLDAFFAAAKEAPSGAWVAMDFHPTDGGVTITEPVTGEVATRGDVVEAMNEWFAEQAYAEIDRVARESTKCKYCGLSPCVVDREYPNMMSIGEYMKKEGHRNNEIWYALYGYMSQAYNGYLGRGNRKQLPICVEGEIKDHYPKGKDDPDYVGFVAGSNEN